ncbi:hypothetical protein Pelo_6726 [Pelomyxa schiedti]|nr:hypothetical protein Pelo_6726 [Pelomyxa schiedti]
MYQIEDVGRETMPSRKSAAPGREKYLPLCNRKWVIGFPNPDVTCIWRVVGGALSEEPPLALARTPWKERFLQFSPLCDDVVMISTRDQVAASRCIVLFCDLKASFDKGKLVVTSRLECSFIGDLQIAGVMWRPDGSINTLHLDSTGHSVLVDRTTEEQVVARFPQYAFVTPVGRNHLFVRARRNFKVYNIQSKKTTATPCTWASPAILCQSGLVAHCGAVSGRKVTFTICDVATGFCVGHFPVCFDSHSEEVGCEAIVSRTTVVVPLKGAYHPPLCNTKWIIGFPTIDTTCIWKIAGGCTAGGCTALCLASTWGTDFLQFSPLCDDVVIKSCWDQGRCVLFCDLQATFDQGKLVVISTLSCSYIHNRVEGVTWRPDGSIYTLNVDSTGHSVLVDLQSEKQVESPFPQYAYVTPIGRSHLFVRAQRDYSKFKVYNVASKKLTATPCTWASPAILCQSGLIAHCGNAIATQFTFTVCDVATGFCIGHFPVSSYDNFDSEYYM